MPGTYTQLLYHVVFSTKRRAPLISADLEESLYRYIGGIIRGERGSLIEIGGEADHVHLLVRFRADISVSKMLQLVKGNSSKWVNEQSGRRLRFEWQVGYGAFTVSESEVPAVRAYVRGQKEHHCKVTFPEELVALLKAHGIEYDEKYLWD